MRELEVEQGTIDWHEERFGCVTGTRLQSALGAKYSQKTKKWTLGDKKIQQTLMYELVSERMSHNHVVEINSEAVKRGNELEPFAIKSASGYTGLSYEVCGMLVCDWIDWFKISPDAVYRENGKIVGGLETKCPNGKKHIEYTLNDEIPKEYFWQVIGPFILSDQIKWWDFASYDDRNYQSELFITSTQRGDYESLIVEARVVLKEFLQMVEEVHEGLTF